MCSSQKKQSVNDVDKLDDFSEQWTGFASIVLMGEQGKKIRSNV